MRMKQKSTEKAKTPWIEPVHASRGLHTMRVGDGIVQCTGHIAIVEAEEMVARAGAWESTPPEPGGNGFKVRLRGWRRVGCALSALGRASAEGGAGFKVSVGKGANRGRRYQQDSY
jgi:hypothetical protein